MARTELAATQEDLVGKTDMFTRVMQCLQLRVRFGCRWFDQINTLLCSQKVGRCNRLTIMPTTHQLRRLSTGPR